MDAAAVETAFTSRQSGRGSTGVGTDSLLQAAQDLGSELTIETAPGYGTRTSALLHADRSGRPVAVVLDRDPLRARSVSEKLHSLGWWVASTGTVEECAAAMERLSAASAFIGRGAAGSSVRELKSSAADLGVSLEAYSTVGDLGR